MINFISSSTIIENTNIKLQNKKVILTACYNDGKKNIFFSLSVSPFSMIRKQRLDLWQSIMANSIEDYG